MRYINDYIMIMNIKLFNPISIGIQNCIYKATLVFCGGSCYDVRLNTCAVVGFRDMQRFEAFIWNLYRQVAKNVPIFIF